jgi:hypothetical protein
LVVQAYCARAGDVADRISKPTINASKRLELFMAGYRIDLVIDIRPRAATLFAGLPC